FHWLRSVYLKPKPRVEKHLQMIYKELQLLLSQMSEMLAQLFVDRLTSYKHYGMSIEQLSLKHKINRYDVPLILTAMVHYMINQIKDNGRDFPFMRFLLHDLSTDGMISKSAMQTYELIQK